MRVWGVIGVEIGGETGTEEMEREAKVFKEKPVHEYRGHTADVLDLSWSKVSGWWIKIRRFKFREIRVWQLAD